MFILKCLASQRYCPNEDDYSPCICTATLWLMCDNISLEMVRQIFKGKNGNSGPLSIETFKLKIPPKDKHVPANLLTEHFVWSDIDLKCFDKGKEQKISIDPEAFSSSRNFTKILNISFCDISELNFSFLRGFDKLWKLSLYSVTNVHLADWKSLPVNDLPGQFDFNLKNSKGFDKWTELPQPMKGIKYCDLSGNEMGDIAMGRILKWIVDSPSVDTLNHLIMTNNALTQIPLQINSFPNLRLLNLDDNVLINATIRSGSLKFSYSIRVVREVHFASCGISTVEPGAFQGN